MNESIDDAAISELTEALSRTIMEKWGTGGDVVGQQAGAIKLDTFGILTALINVAASFSVKSGEFETDRHYRILADQIREDFRRTCHSLRDIHADRAPPPSPAED